MKRRGVVLLVFLLIAVLALLTNSLVLWVATGARRSVSALNEAQLACLAETAVNRTRAHFEADPGFLVDEPSGTLDRCPGFYRLTFHRPGQTWDDSQSVNNLEGESAVQHQGLGREVPAHSAVLVVVARVGGQVRRTEVCLRRGIADPPPYALMSSGQVAFRGGVSLDGLATLGDSTTRAADLHARRGVSWQPLTGTDRADIRGEVSSEGPAGSVDFGPDPTRYSTDGIVTGTPARSLPSVNILAQIDANRSHPTPPVVPTGVTSLAPGTYYWPGDLDLNGDLRLDGATLYVGGKLSVNGAVAGEGSVFVGGETFFKGDSRILTNSPTGVALFSQGSVHVQGFDGAAYMNAVTAGSPTSRQAWQDLQAAVGGLQARIDSSVPLQDNDLIAYTSVISDYNQVAPTLGQSPTATFEGRQENTLATLQSALAAQPDSSVRTFMESRLTELDHLYAWDESNPRNPGGTSWLDVVDNWRTGDRQLYGLLDAVTSSGWDATQRAATLREIGNYVDLLGYDRLGQSYFRGVIYTHGYVFAEHEVTLLGALWAQDDGSQPEGLAGGATARPGDIHLQKGVRMVMLEDYLQQWGAASSSGPLVTGYWVRRE